MPHPIERLRWIARAEGAGSSILAREAAMGLATCADDPASLVTGCRRLLARHPACGPLWWLAANVLVGADPEDEAWRAAQAFDDDPTSQVVEGALAEDASVCVLGWPDQIEAALHRRADCEVLVVDIDGYGAQFARRLVISDVEAVFVPVSGTGSAARDADLLVIEATALGPDGFLAPTGAMAAASSAYVSEVPVWVVAGVGRALPQALWEALCRRVDDGGEPWEVGFEVVPAALATAVAGPAGLDDFDVAAMRADCPVAPELLRWDGA